MDKLHILCATDDNYAQHCGVMICSVCQNHPEHNLCFHIIENNLSDESKIKIDSVVRKFNQENVYYHITEEIIKDFKLAEGIYNNIVIYYRLFVARFLPYNIETVLYLDTDIIVRKDIKEIFSVNLSNYILAAIRDIDQPIHKDQIYQIGLSYNDRYFNSGVLLINLNNWRKEKIEQKLMNFCSKDRNVHFPDQDALNYVIKNQWMELSPSWNRFNLVEYQKVYFRKESDLLEYIYDPYIVHFASNTARPWMNIKYIPFSDEYMKYCNLTPWKNFHKKEVNNWICYRTLLRIKYKNFIFRSPIIIGLLITTIIDILKVIYHLLRYKNLRYYLTNRF